MNFQQFFTFQEHSIWLKGKENVPFHSSIFHSFTFSCSSSHEDRRPCAGKFWLDFCQFFCSFLCLCVLGSTNIRYSK